MVSRLYSKEQILFHLNNSNQQSQLKQEQIISADPIPEIIATAAWHQKQQENLVQQRKSMDEVRPDNDPKVCCDQCCGLNSYWVAPSTCYSMEFCRTSSLHGLRFVGQVSGHFLERMLFGIAFTLAILASAYLIEDLWSKYVKNPTMVTFTEKAIPIEQIPFPAVTICNINNVRKSNKDEYLRIINNPASTSDEKTDARDKLFIQQHICKATSKGFTSKFDFTMSGSHVANELFHIVADNDTQSKEHEKHGLDVNINAAKVDQPCSEMILHCLWQSQPKDCKRIFSEVTTDYGKCCSFNMAPTDMIFQNVVEETKSTNAKISMWSKSQLRVASLLSEPVKRKDDVSPKYPPRPRRVREAGLTNGLSVLLDPDLTEYYCTGSDSVGFALSTHMPIDLPHVSEYNEAIEPKTEVFVKVMPEVVKADEGIRELKIDDRKCYMEGEMNIEHFRYYTLSNCRDECIAELNVKQCGCIHFYMPRAYNWSLCTHANISCSSKLHDAFEDDVLSTNSSCNDCKPNCNSVFYKSDITARPMRGDIDLWSTLNETQVNTTGWKERKLTLVHIYFAEDSIYPKIRKRLYVLNDLIANIGGLLGLCLGFSILSLVELFYFLFVRIVGRNLNEFKPRHVKKILCCCKKQKKKIKQPKQAFKRNDIEELPPQRGFLQLETIPFPKNSVDVVPGDGISNGNGLASYYHNRVRAARNRNAWY